MAVSDVKFDGPAARQAFAGLAYDLGASYVLFPPLAQPLIEDVTAGLMATAVRRCGVAADA